MLIKDNQRRILFDHARRRIERGRKHSVRQDKKQKNNENKVNEKKETDKRMVWKNKG